jgi:putative membrane protein
MATHGDEISSKASDHLANERTLLAWIRTGISVVVFGFVVAKFGITLRQMLSVSRAASVPTGAGASVYLGAVFITIGILAVLAAWVHFARTRVAIERGRFHPSTPGATLLAVAVALLGIALLGYLFFTAAS